ncbi:PorT family protein [Flavobacterium sediminis]|uniref:PorT family protein n=1 Tax=Flavobacterium sediminis TaxID=2201181 RepID=A0A2U8QRX3_9FLAO|nr:porin family protein [Flavobacterium sediminis]AWM12869.1 PorT family protein [Flavobacterium sediminis]
MKKAVIIFTVISSIFSLSSNAQLLQFGIKGGANFANYTGGSVEGIDFNNIASYHAGVVAELNIFDNFAVQPELLYSTQGSELKGLGEQIKNELGYLSLPVLAKFYLTDNGLSLEAGPQFSVLVSERNEIDTSNTNTFDFGIAGGLSYKLTKRLFVSGRYVAGLTDVKKDANVKNSVIQLSVGIMF